MRNNALRATVNFSITFEGTCNSCWGADTTFDQIHKQAIDEIKDAANKIALNGSTIKPIAINIDSVVIKQEPTK